MALDRRRPSLRWAVLAVATLASEPAIAQEDQPAQNAQSAPNAVPAGNVGQRQMREQVTSNVEPMERIASRIDNRIPSRIHNRLDRWYDLQAGAADRIEAANERTRRAGRPKRR